NFISCFIALAISYGIKFVSEFIVIILLSIKGIAIGEILDNQTLKIVFSYITLVLPIIIYRLNYKKNLNILSIKFTKNRKLDKNKIIAYGLIILGSLNVIIMACIVVMANFNSYKIYNKYEVILMSTAICSVLCVTSLIIMVIVVDKNKDIVQIENNLMSNNIKQMTDTVDLLRTQKHDYMNHMQVILMQISNGKNEDARRYILGLAEEVKCNGSSFDTGNNYLDAILNFKNAKCSEVNIELTACIDSILENTAFEDTQLSSIFLNIIDNAIDELQKLNRLNKYIHVDTYIEDCNHIISIKNNGSKILDTNKIFEMGVSSKGNNRGYGLYSIKQMLLRNKSSIYVLSDEEETEFVIKIPILNENNQPLVQV
ncbi:MAG: sensor histidine kinase, partial [Peptostreptococcaceae bacterium]